MAVNMKTIQMTLDEKLVKEVDKKVTKLKTTRSAFAREALRKNLKYYQELELEKKHINGYKNYPIKYNEFSDWENEQVWID